MKYLWIVVALLLLTGCGNTIEEEEYYTPKVGNIGDLATETAWIKTPKQLEVFYRDFIYVSDELPEDEFRSPAETYRLGYGDCEDFAMLSKYILDRAGYDTFILCVFRDGEGHAVLVYNDEGYMNNQYNVRTDTTDLEVVSKGIYKDYKFYTVWRYKSE